MKRICVLLIFEGANHAFVFLSKKDEPNPFSPLPLPHRVKESCFFVCPCCLPPPHTHTTLRPLSLTATLLPRGPAVCLSAARGMLVLPVIPVCSLSRTVCLLFICVLACSPDYFLLPIFFLFLIKFFY